MLAINPKPYSPPIIITTVIESMLAKIVQALATTLLIIFTVKERK